MSQMISISDSESFREKIRGKLNPLFKDESITTNVEKGIYNYAIKEANSRKIIKKWDNPHFTQIYLDRLRSIYLNLKNGDLLTQITQKEITPQTLAFMTHQEMNSAHWKDLIEKKMQRDSSKYNTTIEASTDMYTCRKCKSRRSSYYEMQTRSADEPSTIFVTCLDCGKLSKH
jgi:transcription elongation factor S-II